VGRRGSAFPPRWPSRDDGAGRSIFTAPAGAPLFFSPSYFSPPGDRSGLSLTFVSSGAGGLFVGHAGCVAAAVRNVVRQAAARSPSASIPVMGLLYMLLGLAAAVDARGGEPADGASDSAACTSFFGLRDRKEIRWLRPANSEGRRSRARAVPERLAFPRLRSHDSRENPPGDHQRPGGQSEPDRSNELKEIVQTTDGKQSASHARKLEDARYLVVPEELRWPRAAAPNTH